MLQSHVYGFEGLECLAYNNKSLALKRFIQTALFHMETTELVLRSVQKDNWMASIDLKDAYLLASIHPKSLKYFCSVAQGNVFQFKVLCFSIMAVTQVFTRFMATVSVFLHQVQI